MVIIIIMYVTINKQEIQNNKTKNFNTTTTSLDWLSLYVLNVAMYI
jgi:hypothetical protein